MIHLRLQSLLQEATETITESSMQPFLTDRIMRRVQVLSQPEEYFFQTLWLAFKPIAVTSAFLTLAFISYNTFLSRSYEVTPTPIEIVFGLQPMTLTSAYSADLNQFPPVIP